VPAYIPPAVISLGEEWTGEPSSLDLDVDVDVAPGSPSSCFPSSPSESASELSLSPEHSPGQLPLPLWQAEHARLVSLRDAVLTAERAARHREACLESEVARLKDDLARVQDARARAAASAPIPLARRASDSDVATHHRRDASSTSSWFDDDDDDDDVNDNDSDTTIDDAPIPAESAGQFWDEHYPDPETTLATHLTEARSARAEERRKRRHVHERIRELAILLSLGSEVRQWEERLAWANAFRTPANDDDADADAMELDHHAVEGTPRRRAKSLPITPSSSSTSSSTTLTPPLPPLSASPLWRVSAEMILRRRSLSERPRRLTPVTSLPPPPTPSEEGTPAVLDPSTSSSSPNLSISIPTCSPSIVPSSLRSAPSRPSSLKLSFTLDDLLAPEDAEVDAEVEAVAVGEEEEKIEACAREDEEMRNSEESSEASDSDDSRCKSSSSNSSSSENENEHESEGEKPLAIRRGRSRWSWRKSLQAAQQLQQQLQQIAVDMEVDDP
jgi:hypothetical protein